MRTLQRHPLALTSAYGAEIDSCLYSRLSSVGVIFTDENKQDGCHQSAEVVKLAHSPGRDRLCPIQSAG